jgi:NTE family protein
VAGRALVLGGGGVTGAAWELGMLAGLAQADLHLAAADVVIGTSAGSVVAAQIATGTPLEQLYSAQLAWYAPRVALRPRLGTIARLASATIGSRDPRKGRARAGAIALAARTAPEEERRAIIAARLPVHEWPDRKLLVTAVAADDGELVVFDRESGVPLVDAVAASCAVPGVWPPATINGRRYIDGGIRSPINADLAYGNRHVVVLAPVVASLRRGTGAVAQVAALRHSARVSLVVPDMAALRAIGRNSHDYARRAPAARAGRRQATDVAAEVARTWTAD